MIRVLVVLMSVLPVVASAQEAFQLPSGNIHCMLFEGRLRCDILQFNFPRPPRPRGCTEDWGDAVEIGARGPAVFLCHGDTVANPQAPFLQYGTAWQGPCMSCTAAQTGLRCVNGEGRGFEISRARVRVF